MKRLISILLVLSVLLLAFPCAVFAEEGASRRDIPLDSDEFKALQHEVYEANQLEALLERHESVTFDMSDAPENDYDWRDYWYITRDACYYESPSTTQYETDRYFYTLTDPDAGAQLLYGLDLCSDYDLWTVAGYQSPPKDEADWSNSELEEHDACYVENGLLVLRDRRNPEASEAWFAEHVPYETYDGETVYSEFVADAETQDALGIQTTLTDAAGKTLLTQEDSFTYDVAAYDPAAEGEPFAQYFAEALDPERSRTITFIFDPGTDDERATDCVQPRHAFFSVFLDDEYVEQVYTDPECTQPFEGSDGEQDLVL